jgi:hypothetical protein
MGKKASMYTKCALMAAEGTQRSEPPLRVSKSQVRFMPRRRHDVASLHGIWGITCDKWSQTLVRSRERKIKFAGQRQNAPQRRKGLRRGLMNQNSMEAVADL